LFEELLNDTSKTLPTHNDKILIAQDVFEEFEELKILVEDLYSSSSKLSNDAIVTKMKKIVPEFNSMNSVFEKLDIKINF